MFYAGVREWSVHSTCALQFIILYWSSNTCSFIFSLQHCRNEILSVIQFQFSPEISHCIYNRCQVRDKRRTTNQKDRQRNLFFLSLSKVICARACFRDPLDRRCDHMCLVQSDRKRKEEEEEKKSPDCIGRARKRIVHEPNLGRRWQNKEPKFIAPDDCQTTLTTFLDHCCSGNKEFHVTF